MKIRNTEFDFNKHTYVMGILNVTPDSFSDNGMYGTYEKAVERARRMIEEGADIIDVGGESTRPGYTPVNPDDEINRVIPVIKAIREFSDIPISIDTTKAVVAKQAMEAGADIINDISGMLKDSEMFSVASSSRAVCILCHNSDMFSGEDKRTLDNEESYVNQVVSHLIFLSTQAEEAGIDSDKIILDVGIGFGKSTDENLVLLNELPRLSALDYPLVLGCSRKSVIGNVLGVPENERLEGTIVTSTLGVLAGVSILRVHDVKENVRAVTMTEAICERN